MPPIDRLLSQYSAPIESWPGEEDLDAEAYANWRAANPQKLQTEGGAIDKGDLLPLVRYPQEKKAPSEWQSSSDVMRQLDDGWRIEPFARLSAPFKSMGEALRTQPWLGPMVRPSQMHPEVFNQMTSDAMTVAGTAATGGIGRAASAPHLPHGTAELGIFGGRKAKTADLDALARAEEMVRLGRPREEVWSETGWFQGPDQKWRFEIDDSADYVAGTGALYRPGKLRSEILDQGASKEGIEASGYQGRLDDVLDHKDVFAAYPPLAGTTWASLPGDKMALPNYAGAWKGDRFGMEVNAGISPSLPRGKSVTLHELQHAIQDKEGFAKGANLDVFKMTPEMMTEANRNLVTLGDAEYIQHYARTRGVSIQDAVSMINQESVDVMGQNAVPLRAASIEMAETLSPDKIDAMSKRLLERIKDARDPMSAYNRTAGEAEARLVQKRMDLTPKERRARPPWLDYDVPESDQIVRFGSGEGASVSSNGPKYPMAPRDRWYGEANYETTGGQMREMTPDEFLRAARPLDPSEELTRENINDLKRHIQEGGELDPLQLYKGGKEDGRHRAYAAKELGIDRVPVIDFRGDASSPNLMASIDPLSMAMGSAKEAAKAGSQAKVIDALSPSDIDTFAKAGLLDRKKIEGISVGQLLSRLEKGKKGFKWGGRAN